MRHLRQRRKPVLDLRVESQEGNHRRLESAGSGAASHLFGAFSRTITRKRNGMYLLGFWRPAQGDKRGLLLAVHVGRVDKHTVTFAH